MQLLANSNSHAYLLRIFSNQTRSICAKSIHQNGTNIASVQESITFKARERERERESAFSSSAYSFRPILKVSSATFICWAKSLASWPLYTTSRGSYVASVQFCNIAVPPDYCGHWWEEEEEEQAGQAVVVFLAISLAASLPKWLTGLNCSTYLIVCSINLLARCFDPIFIRLIYSPSLANF